MNDTDRIKELEEEVGMFRNYFLDNLNGERIVKLLIEKPEIGKYMKDEHWSKLSGWNWSDLLRYQPQFSKYCNWDKLDSEDWSYLLYYQPQFEKFRKELIE